MLVIEGPDMIGKTWLCDSVVGRLRHDNKLVARKHAYTSETAAAMGRDAEEYAQHCVPLAVCDRFHLSEVVYGHVARGESRLTWGALRRVREAIETAGGLTVVLTAPTETYAVICDEHHARGEQFDVETCMRANAAFRVLIGSDEASDRELLTRKTLNALKAYQLTNPTQAFCRQHKMYTVTHDPANASMTARVDWVHDGFASAVAAVYAKRQRLVSAK